MGFRKTMLAIAAGDFGGPNLSQIRSGLLKKSDLCWRFVG
jgi:hypothetical protein